MKNPFNPISSVGQSVVLITHKRCYANEGAIPSIVRVSDAKVTGSNPVWDILRELTAKNKRCFIIL